MSTNLRNIAQKVSDNSMKTANIEIIVNGEYVIADRLDIETIKQIIEIIKKINK